jgi:hypothetical protein
MHLDAELNHVAAKEHLGHGNFAKKSPERHAWPFDLLSIGHAISSYQNYGGSQPYFHHGLDIRGEALQEVHASVGGVVVNIENYSAGELYWEVAIRDDEGFLWQYHHIDQTTIPQAIKEAFKNKGRVTTGALLGKIVRWPISTYGEMYHHVHLNILDGSGNYLNPFEFLEELPDNSAPEIVAIKFLKNGRSQSGTTISGTYQFSLEVRDLILHEKFIVPPHRMTYSIDGQKEETFWQFDSLPGGASRTDFVHDLYVARETCGNYTCRKLVFNLGFSKNGTRSFPQSSGPHSLDVTVWDYAGNKTSSRFNYSIP